MADLEPKLTYTQGENAGHVAAVLGFLRRRYPAQAEERYTDEYWQELRSEFRVHDFISQYSLPFTLFAGIVLPSLLREMLFETRSVGFTDICFAFGFAPLMSLAYLGLVCLVKGPQRSLRRMRDYSTMMHGIPCRVQLKMVLWIMVPGLVLGILGIFL
jgi:hypothetical protein